jgi:hypothetical protein
VSCKTFAFFFIEDTQKAKKAGRRYIRHSKGLFYKKKPGRQKIESGFKFSQKENNFIFQFISIKQSNPFGPNILVGVGLKLGKFLIQ